MAVFSLIRKSQIGGSQRLDAEYYQPKYLQLDTILTGRSVPLRKIATIKGGKRLPIGETFVEEGVPYVRVTDIQNFYIDFTSVAKITEELHLRLNRYQISYEEIAIAIVGNTIGLVGFMLEQIAPCNLTENCARIISNSLSPYYLSIFLSCKYGQLQVKRLTVGTAQPKFGLDKIAILQVYIPKSFELIIEGLNREAYKRFSKSFSLYHQAEQLLLSELGLLDWKPARTLTFVGSYRDAARAQRTDAEYFHPKFKEMLDKVPQQIKFDRLGRLTTYKKGVEVGSSAYTDSGIPFWRVSNLSSHGLDDSNANFINQELYENLRQDYEPQQGEILLSKDATPGIAYYLEYPTQGIISSGILRLVIADAIPPHYLEIVLNSLFVQIQIEQDAGGSIIKHWKPSKVSKTLIPRLSDDKEKEIANLVQRSHAARREAKALFEKAKRAVEIAIEESEERAIEFIG